MLIVMMAGMMIATALHAQPVPRATRELSPATCATFTPADACRLFAETAPLMTTSYARRPKGELGKKALMEMGYDATFLSARHNMFANKPNFFLASRKRTGRVFVIFPGTEGTFDWMQNALFGAYTDRVNDGKFYVPPGHAGFRRAVLNIYNSNLVRADEFAGGPLNCSAADPRRSALAAHVCEHEVMRPGSDKIDLVLVGHSRGAGIAQLASPMFHGLRWNGRQVAPAANWPYRVEAVFAYAPPYAIYRRPDSEVFASARDLPSQWDVLTNHGLIERTFMVIQDADMVPAIWSPLNYKHDAHFSQGRHYGKLIRITRDGELRWEPTDWSVESPHLPEGYCRAVAAAFGRTADCERP